MPFDAWPNTLQTAWLKACETPDFLEEGGALADLSDSYRENIIRTGGRFLAWVAESGQTCSSVDDLVGAAGHASITAFTQAEYAAGIKASSLHTRMACLVRFLEAVCPGWQEPGETRQMILRIKRRARREPVAERLMAHPSTLFGAALARLDHLLPPDGHPLDATGWQSALMVAMLIAAPIRVGNFSRLRIGENFQRSKGGWSILLSKEETKARRADHWQLPAHLHRYIDHFIETVRPCLLHGECRAPSCHDYLWVGAFGAPLEHQGVRQRIKALTAELIGKAILPHSFRHSAASAFSVEHPDRPRDCAALLGHASPRTTEEHYILGTRQLALDTLHNAIEDIRRKKSASRRGRER